MITISITYVNLVAITRITIVWSWSLASIVNFVLWLRQRCVSMWGLTQLVWSLLRVARDFPLLLKCWDISTCMMIVRNLYVKIVIQSITQEQPWTYIRWANMALDIHAPIVVLFFIHLCSAIGIRNIAFSYVCLFYSFAPFCNLCHPSVCRLMWCFHMGLCLCHLPQCCYTFDMAIPNFYVCY